MGLYQWVAKQVPDGSLELASPSANQELSSHEPRSPGESACIESKPRRSQESLAPGADGRAQPGPMKVPDGLWAHLAQLPLELASKIASHAFLSPKQASEIPIDAQPARHYYPRYASPKALLLSSACAYCAARDMHYASGIMEDIGISYAASSSEGIYWVPLMSNFQVAHVEQALPCPEAFPVQDFSMVLAS